MPCVAVPIMVYGDVVRVNPAVGAVIAVSGFTNAPVVKDHVPVKEVSLAASLVQV